MAMAATKNALVVRGGWDGHQPKEATELFIPFLETSGFTVRVEGSPQVYADADYMRGVDLIVSNQLHAAWSLALLDAGFRLGPSNYLLAASPALAACAGTARDDEFHINRGDGDGPIHL